MIRGIKTEVWPNGYALNCPEYDRHLDRGCRWCITAGNTAVLKLQTIQSTAHDKCKTAHLASCREVQEVNKWGTLVTEGA